MSQRISQTVRDGVHPGFTTVAAELAEPLPGLDTEHPGVFVRHLFEVEFTVGLEGDDSFAGGEGPRIAHGTAWSCRLLGLLQPRWRNLR